MKVKLLSRVRLLAIPWTAAHQAPPSMGFSRQEYWSGVPLPSLLSLFTFGQLPCVFLFIFKLLYNIAVFFAIHSHESAMSIHVSPILNPLLLPSPSHCSGSSQRTSPEHPVSCIEPGLAIYFIYDNIHVSMLFSQIIPPLPSPTESKRLFYTSVSLLLSCIPSLPSF